MTGFQEQVFDEKDLTKDMFSSFADALTPVMAAHLCDLAYYEATEIKRTLEKVKLYRQFDYFEGESVFYFVVETVHYVAVIFRGTFNKLGWMTNIDIRARHTIFGPIHNGFAQDFVDIQNSLFKSKISLYKRRRIFIAGHSKGGALASLCAIFLIENGFSRTSTYTFGSPRAFCATFPFEKYKEASIINYCRRGDPICYFPPHVKEVPLFAMLLVKEIFFYCINSIRGKTVRWFRSSRRLPRSME